MTKELSAFAPKNNLITNCENCNKLLSDSEPQKIAFYTKNGEQVLCNDCWILYVKKEL
jgi:hypothetical protein